jgi:hypothetical protein
MSEEVGEILFLGILFLSILFFCSCSLKHCCESCFGSKIPCLEPESQENDQSEQYLADREFAENLQRRMNEEERGRDRLAKRKERAMWYEYYLKPWTVVVKTSDLFYTHRDNLDSGKGGQEEEEEEEDGTLMVETSTKLRSNDADDVKSGSDIEEVSNDVDGRGRAIQCTICDKDDENATLCLSFSASGRCVDGTCAFCLEEYEAGDEIVYSDMQCEHVFHKDCLMQWLSTGKKRCPVCRHWFVPGSKIDDQKVTHGESWRRAEAEMTLKQKQREKEEIEKEAIEVREEAKSTNVAESTETSLSDQSTTMAIMSKTQDTKLARDDLNDSEIFASASSLAISVSVEIDDVERHRTVVSTSPVETTTEENSAAKCSALNGEYNDETKNPSSTNKSEEFIDY